MTMPEYLVKVGGSFVETAVIVTADTAAFAEEIALQRAHSGDVKWEYVGSHEQIRVTGTYPLGNGDDDD